MNCFYCKGEIQVQERVGFRETCARCGRALHVCRNCQHHDPAYHNQCREPMAEQVADKERSNFCEYFAPAIQTTARKDTAGDARARLEALFNKGGGKAKQ